MNQNTSGAAGPVVQYFEGNFQYFEPECVLTVQPGGIQLPGNLLGYLRDIVALTPKCWLVGVDATKNLIEVKPGEEHDFRAIMSEENGILLSVELAAWLKVTGVPDRVRVRWQPKTGSIVGKYEAVKAEAVEQKEKATTSQAVTPRVRVQPAPIPSSTSSVTTPTEDPVGVGVLVSRSGGHKWVRSRFNSPTGKPLLVCEVCGMYVADPATPSVYERPCYPGCYVDCYDIDGDKVTSVKGSFDRAIKNHEAKMKAEGRFAAKNAGEPQDG